MNAMKLICVEEIRQEHTATLTTTKAFQKVNRSVYLHTLMNQSQTLISLKYLMLCEVK